MALRSRLLMKTCLIALVTGTGFAATGAFAQSSAPLPLFLKQEAEQDARSQGTNDQEQTNPPLLGNGTFGNSTTTSPSDGLDNFPSDPDAVQSLTLQAVDAEAVGTIDQSRGGLGIDMWNGTTRASAVRLISQLPAVPATHTARDLQERMLLSIAALPQGNSDVSILDARIAKLIEMGALQAAIDLVNATPQGARGSILAQAEVNALLIAGQMDQACDAITGYSASFDDLFWLKASALCALYNNDPTAAAFSVDLVREMDGERDQTFFGLVRAIRSGTTADGDLLTDLRPLDIALLAIAKQPIPTSQLETGKATAIIGMVQAESTPTDIRLEAARKAENMGLISAAELGDVYASIDFTDEALANALDDAPEGVMGRQYAKLYQAARQTDVPAARAEILAALFETAEIEGDFLQATRLGGDLINDIPVNSDFSWFAIAALKASIATNSMERAENWLEVAKSSANSGNDIASRLSLLYPVLAISGLEDTGAPQPIDPNDTQASSNLVQQQFGLGGAVASNTPAQTEMQGDPQALAYHRGRMTEWQEIQNARGDQDQARRNSELVFNLFDGFGIEVPDGFWDALLRAPFSEDRLTISSAVSHQLATAALDGEKAKAVALVIFAQQIANQDNADPKDLADTVAALRTIGFDLDARRLATELLLAAGN
ncbi:antifreeze glycopeptide [Thalassospira sp. MA62]|nr:antifreeze glycopeptide [Thalassospira sp. MA62]